MAVPTDQQQHRIAFGKAVSAWMRINGWSQQTIHDWATAAETAGPWNSSTSLLQRGRLDPKPQLFVAFGTLNHDLATGNLRYLTARGLRDRIVGGEPFMTENDTVATATDLFSMFIGEMRPSDRYDKAPELTEDDAAEMTVKLQQQFADLSLELMVPAKEAWQQVEQQCQELGMSKAQIAHFRKVLVGLAEYSAEELKALLTEPQEQPLPFRALHMVR